MHALCFDDVRMYVSYSMRIRRNADFLHTYTKDVWIFHSYIYDMFFKTEKDLYLA